MNPNFYLSSLRASDHGQCDAFLKADMPGCRFYEAGKDGWCQHTLKELKYEETVPPAHPWLRPTTQTKIFKDHVTGECHSEPAAKEAGEKSP